MVREATQQGQSSEEDTDDDDELQQQIDMLEPEQVNGPEEDQADTSYLDTGLESALWIFNMFVKSWSTCWIPGKYIVKDESMIYWTGIGGAHLTQLPKKSSPLGIGMKTIVDHTSGVMLLAEMLMGKHKDRKNEFTAQYGPATGTVLRLAKPWFGTARVVVADS